MLNVFYSQYHLKLFTSSTGCQQLMQIRLCRIRSWSRILKHFLDLLMLSVKRENNSRVIMMLWMCFMGLKMTLRISHRFWENLFQDIVELIEEYKQIIFLAWPTQRQERKQWKVNKESTQTRETHWDRLVPSSPNIIDLNNKTTTTDLK